MDYIELGEVQERFAEIIWEHAPISSGELVKICEKELSWKKPTTYTVLRKLCEKGLFANEDGKVRVIITKEEFDSAKSNRFVEENFAGSLPLFISAFTAKKRMSRTEIDEIQKLIDEMKSGQ